ncbi:hypothetical protein EV421DRAFT_1888685 [Armillaria borealis]|uniref:Uncharacterized protein n=1 Tax=Armillaria borealis TaxID=47425 RepID=A0AA39MY20_9AGAR|nr:hypothetical protein EV421DRAFT_1888685 [Armillaria borealis]
MLCDSTLDGYKFPNDRDRLITMLFADDTTIIWRKVQVIPIGSLGYKQTVLETRKTSPVQTAIPADVHIARDGEAVRIVGTLGEFDVWEKTHPTIEGRRLLIQMYVGELTQFLTRAQGMPDSVLLQIQKMISNFAWDNLLNRSIMSATIAEGGMQVLDIKIRNDVIEVMKLKSYLRFD